VCETREQAISALLPFEKPTTFLRIVSSAVQHLPGKNAKRMTEELR